MGALDAARKLGRDIGETLSIAGFDAPCGMELPPYGITALRQDTGQLARDAVQILKRMIDTDDLFSGCCNPSDGVSCTHFDQTASYGKVKHLQKKMPDDWRD